MIIDFHTHAFPDHLAERALQTLQDNSGGLPVHHDGSVGGLLDSMDRAGVEVSVIASIATRPGQFENILAWSKKIRGRRLIPFASLHPQCPDPAAAIGSIAAEGMPGVKLHALYQEFFLDDRAVYPIYEELQAHKLILLIHAGYDIAFPGNRQAEPRRILTLHRDFPRLKLVAAHLGGWSLWDEVLENLAGEDIYLEGSMAIDYCAPDTLQAILNRHDERRVLFGSDAPWTDQSREVNSWQTLGLPDRQLEKIFSLNAQALLGSREEEDDAR